jgi:glycosyltransferase involved in cell wall biosynthesis
MRLDYSIVIPAYNEEELLPRTLSLLKNAMTRVKGLGEVIVVDNNSADRTADIARGSGARVVSEPVNQISRARNAGARAATGRNLIFLDADTMPSAELLEAALTRLDKGAAGGGAFIELASDHASPRARLSLIRRILPTLSWGLMKLGICGGSFIFCRREAFDAVGGFSEKVYAAEDVLMSRALRKWGKRNGRPFEIFTEPPIRSSDRKIHSHSPLSLLTTVLVFAVFPFAVRFKAFCRLWYARPAK